MAEVAPAPATAPAAAPNKTPKKKSSAKPKKSGPSVSDLIVKAVSASNERSGLSLAGLKKALAAGGYDVEKNNSRVKLAVKSLVGKGTLVQTKGTGASGSFKINKKRTEAKEKAAKKKTSPKAKKPVAKKPAAKKPKKAAAKKPVAVKKSPKKAKKPAAAKKATKSPKKAKPAAAKPKKPAKTAKKAKTAKSKVAKPKTVKKSAALQSVFGQAAARRIFAVAHSHNPLQLRPPFSPVSHPLGDTVTTSTQNQSSVKQIYLQRNTNHRIEVSMPPYVDTTSTYVKRSPMLSETPTTSSLLPASSVVESASVPSSTLSFSRPTADLPSYLEAMPRFSVLPAATGELCDRDQAENGVKSQPISVHEGSLKNSVPLSETPPCYEDALKMETTADVMIRRLPLSTQASNLPPVLETSETEAQAVLH
ncbi:H1 protein, partial [Polypterus senegalus]